MIKLKVNKNEYSLITELGATYNNEKRYYEVPTNLPIIKFQKYVPLAIELLMVKSIDYNDFLDFLFTKKNLETLKTNYIKRNCNCEICGKKSHNNRVIEVWKYSMRAKIQVFDRFETVCPDCYKYKYIMDYDEVEDFDHFDIEHFKKINSCVKKDFVEYYNEIVEVRNKCLNKLWVVDVNRLYVMMGITPLIKTSYSGMELEKLMRDVRKFASCEKQLLPDKKLQKKLISYTLKKEKSKDALSGDSATRIVMLGKMMEYNYMK